MRPLSEYHRSKAHPALLQAIDDAIRLGLSDQVYQAFHNQFSSAKQRQIAFEFTLETWWAWWQILDPEHGCIRWERRGIGKDALVMVR